MRSHRASHGFAQEAHLAKLVTFVLLLVDMSTENPKVLPSSSTAEKCGSVPRSAMRNIKPDAGSGSLGTVGVKSGLAQMLKGGVIMDVVNAEQARIAEEAGACAVMALERVPADIRADGGVARMSDPAMIQELSLIHISEPTRPY